MEQFKICIVTPSYNHVKWLKRCAASVADQAPSSVEITSAPIRVHHHVQDAGSNDGTVEFLESHRAAVESAGGGRGDSFYSFSYASEPDEGMYDAINKGLGRMEGDIYAYLNCDEQYLEGTLEAVARHFMDHPEADAVYGDMLLVDAEGDLVAYRKSYVLRESYVVAAHLYVPPCTLFWRSSILERGVRFDTKWKARGDAEFVLQLLGMGVRFAHLRRYLTAFFLTGDNLGSSDLAREEHVRARGPVSFRRKIWFGLLNGLRFAEKAMSGAYATRFPLKYSVYQSDEQPRTEKVAETGSFRYRE